jgi:hypothetical protein
MLELKSQVVSFEISENLFMLGYVGTFFYYNIYNKQLYTEYKVTHNEAMPAPTLAEAAEWLNEQYGAKVGPVSQEISDFLKTIS